MEFKYELFPGNIHHDAKCEICSPGGWMEFELFWGKLFNLGDNFNTCVTLQRTHTKCYKIR